jgi:hypothetical protein
MFQASVGTLWLTTPRRFGNLLSAGNRPRVRSSSEARRALLCWGGTPHRLSRAFLVAKEGLKVVPVFNMVQAAATRAQ